MTWRFGETRRERDDRRWEASQRHRQEARRIESARLKGIREEQERQENQAHEDEFNRLKALVHEYAPRACEVCNAKQERRSRVKNAAKRLGRWVMTLSFQAGVAASMVVLVPLLRELIGV